MDDKRISVTTDYEPNFIMRDPQPQAQRPAQPQPQRPAQPQPQQPQPQPPQRPAQAQPSQQGSAVWRNHASESPIAENTSYVNPRTYQGGEDTIRPQRNAGAQAEAGGQFRDPREGFTTRADAAGTAQRASARWSGGRPRAEGNAFSSGEETPEGPSDGGEPRKRGKVRDKMKKRVVMSRKAIALLMAGCMAISCAFGLGGAYVGNQLWGSGSTGVFQADSTEEDAAAGDVSTTGYNLQNATGSNMTIQEITKAAQKSVVEIKTEGAVSDSWMQQYVTEGAGSGVIISKDGYIMTNNHVIANANKITVTTIDKHSYEASVVGTDENNDVAVIKVKATGLTPAVYGNSDQLSVGDLAVAIGNPLGELGGTVTAGIISATDRELVIDGRTMKLLQTDSSINPGNSGGGLFNGDGQLIGLVVAKSSGSDVEGLGFAIPVNTAASVAQQLMDKGYVSGQPWTGMTYTEGSSALDFIFGDGASGTVLVYSVDTKTAQKAGFKPGDVVQSVDDHEITSIEDLTSVITAHKVGDELTFVVVRDGETLKLKLTLQEKTKEQQQGQEQQQEQEKDD